MDKLEVIRIIFVATVLTLAFGLFVYLSLTFHNEAAELREQNESLRDRVIELTAENEWLKNRNEVLEESE